MENIKDVIEMIDFFYVNKHLYDKLLKRNKAETSQVQSLD